MANRPQDGVFRGWQRVRRWLADERVSYLYHVDTEAFQPVEVPEASSFAIYLCTAETLTACRAAVEALPPIIAAGVERGHLGMLAVVERRWVCRISAVLGSGERFVHGYRFPLNRHSAYIENLETLEGWRGRGIAPLLLARLVDALREHGVRAIYCCIDIDNTPSMRTVEKCACRRIGVLVSRRRFGRWASRLAMLDDAYLPQG